MGDELMLVFGEDGVAREYEDDFDITIHCENKEEQEAVLKKLNQDDWIPCSEDLPEAECGESENVLATCGHRSKKYGNHRWVKMLYFNGSNWCHPTGEPYEQRVLAWKPIPEPYQGGEVPHESPMGRRVYDSNI